MAEYFKLMKNPDTDEIHLFQYELYRDKYGELDYRLIKCESICGKVNKFECIDYSSVISKDDTFKLELQLQDKICGNCCASLHHDKQ